MDAKEYLYRAKNMDDYINAKIQEAAQLRSRDHGVPQEMKNRWEREL